MLPTNRFKIIFPEINTVDYLELSFPEEQALSDNEFFQFCQENELIKPERNKEGKILIRTLPGLNTSRRNVHITVELTLWNRTHNFGLVLPNVGFYLPDGAMFSPNVAVLSQASWENLTKKERDQFPYVCPEFVVELMSNSDRLNTLQEKMQNWLANGAKLAWLIDPAEEKVYIYRPQQPIKIVAGFDHIISGEEILKGLSFDLKVLR